MQTPISPTVRRRRLGRELRRLREARDLKLSAAAKSSGVPLSTLSNIENAEARRIKPRDIQVLAELYEASVEELNALLELAKESKELGWWSRYKDVFGGNALPDFEVEASMIRTFECQVIPGLLQTPGYAEAIFRGGRTYSSAVVQRGVDARMERQSILSRQKPPHLWAVIDEAALRRHPDDPKIMHHQLQHLINVANHHNIDLQVLPFSAGMHSGLAGSFYLLDFPGELDPSIVYTENATDSLFVQDSESIQRFVTIFSDLNAAALRAPQSVRLIRQIMESLDHHEHD